MKTVRMFVLIIAVTCGALFTLGQSKADSKVSIGDLAGTWVIDDDYIQSKGNQAWVITVSGDQVRIQKSLHYSNSQREIVLFADRRGETNESSRGGSVVSRSAWKDGKLIREYSYDTNGQQAAPFQPNYSTANVKEMYYLSGDRTKLIFRRDDDSRWPNRNTPVKMGRAHEDKIVLRRKID